MSICGRTILLVVESVHHIDQLSLTLRRKVLIGLFIFDACFAALLGSASLTLLEAWMALNVIVILISLLVWWVLRERRPSIFFSYQGSQKRQYGSPQTTLQGETVKSYGEKMIADYFFKNNIRYEYERPAWGNGWTYGNRIIGRPDFYLLDFDVYVEYWGMLDADDPNDRQEYVRGMKWKMAKYHENGIKFISIYPRNLGNLDWVFRTKLRDGTGIEFG